MIKKVLLGLLGLIILAAVGGAGFAYAKVSAFDASMAKVYDVPLPVIERSDDPQVLERGRHLAGALGSCQACHGQDLGGGKVEEMGPLGKFGSGNVTAGRNGALAVYTDPELARLIKHGIRRDGTSLRFMPSMDFSWWPHHDVVALISYLRTVPEVDSEPAVMELGMMAKVLDRLDMFHLDVARRIDHASLPVAPAPAPTAEYGSFVSSLCLGCHGKGLSGGPIPGAPSSLPIPSNLTPHQSGLEGWTFADFERLMREGVRKDGQKLDPFMPIEATRNFDDTEMRALWAYLESVPPVPFGGR